MDWTDLPSLTALRAFEAAARNLSFSAAGREMNVTHAAVSQQVRRLEDRLGAALLVRSGRGLELTEDGRWLAARLTESFDGLRSAVAAFSTAAEERPLRVTLTPMFAADWLMPRLGDFRAAHPDVELMLNPSPDLIDLRREPYDLAIRFGTGDWPGLEAEPFLPSGFIVVAAPALVEGVSLEDYSDLTRLPWVVQEGNDEFDVWMAAHGVHVSGKHDITHLPGYMVLPAARAGQGIALVSRILVDDDLAASRLVGLFEDAEYRGARAGYYLARRPGPMREVTKQFARWLRRAARDDGRTSRMS